MEFWAGLDSLIKVVIAYLKDVSSVITWPVVAIIAGLTFFSSIKKFIIVLTERVEKGSGLKLPGMSIDELKPSTIEEKKEKIVEEVRENSEVQTKIGFNASPPKQEIGRAILAQNLALFRIENELNINILKDRKIGEYVFDGIHYSKNFVTVFEVKYIKDLKYALRNKFKYSSDILKASNNLIKNKILSSVGMFSYVLIIVYEFYDGDKDEIKFQILSDLNMNKQLTNLEVRFFEFNELMSLE